MNKKILLLITMVLIPVVLGFLIGTIVDSSNVYNSMIKPSFAPPGIVFPIVWTILYILMGISSYYLVQEDKKEILKIYFYQLGINLLWPFIYFVLKNYLLSLIWIALLIIAVIYMLYKLYKFKKALFYLNIPYLLWLIFAMVLNIYVFILN